MKNPRRAGEVALVVILMGALFWLVTAYKLARIDQLYGDSAMYMQAVQNVVLEGAPVSQVQSRIVHYLDEEHFLSRPVEQIATDPGPLFGVRTPATERNLLLGHAYLVLYPLAQLTRFLSVRDVLFGSYVLAYLGTIVMVYAALRRRGVSITGSGIFCLLAASHPAWWQGLLLGQFYPDRLFVLFGLGFMLLAETGDRPRTKRIPNEAWLLALGLACASVNERGASVAGMFLIAHTALFWRNRSLNKPYRLALGAALFLYGYVVVKVLLSHTNGSYEGGHFLPSSIADAVYRLGRADFDAKLTLFFLANAPLLVLAAFRGRCLLIALFLMLPNIFGDIGGAEKTGWATHYPSFFLPSLIWAGLLGYASLTERLRERGAARLSIAVAAALAAFLWVLDPNTAPGTVKPANVESSMLPTFAENLRLYVFQRTTSDSLAAAARTLEQTIPPHTTVSSIELGMSLLYPGRIIDYFPSGIDHADYAVLGAQLIDGKIAYNGALDYLGPAEQTKLNELVVDRMRQDGYDVDHPVMLSSLAGLAVVKRIH